MARKSTNGQQQTTTYLKSTKEENKHLTTLSKHKHFYEFYMGCGEIVNFSHEIQNEILTAYRELADPNYHYQNTCPVCVAEFLVRVYNWYNQNINE